MCLTGGIFPVARGQGCDIIIIIQGDTSCWFKPPVDIKTKVPFWPSLPWTGQAKTELLFWYQRAAWKKQLSVNLFLNPDLNPGNPRFQLFVVTPLAVSHAAKISFNSWNSGDPAGDIFFWLLMAPWTHLMSRRAEGRMDFRFSYVFCQHFAHAHIFPT